jgi:hypothetical protein
MARVADLKKLKNIYLDILVNYFKWQPAYSLPILPFTMTQVLVIQNALNEFRQL